MNRHLFDFSAMETVAERLQSVRPAISELFVTSGCPGLSLGVLHQGRLVHTEHFGCRDISTDSPPNDKTIYRIASLSKPITVGVVASLVDEGALDWNTPIREYLPEFGERRDEVGQKATLIDLLSNRTGLAIANALWGQKNGVFLMPKDEIVHTSCFVPTVRPFRKSFVYGNWNYALVTEVVERVTGKNFGEVVKERILDPLNMQRTTYGMPEDDNMCASHAIRNDGTPCKIPYFNYSDRTGMAGGGAGKSTIEDLLILYKSMLFAYNHQAKTGLTSTPGSPLTQLQTVFAPYINPGPSPIEDQAYCLGLYKTRLPGKLGMASINSAYLGVKRMPIFGAKHAGLEIWHHTANLPGSLASSFFVPSTETAIVVVTNCLGLSDPTDGIGQLILSALLNEPPCEDYVGISKAVSQNALGVYEHLNNLLAQGKTSEPPQHPLTAYEGDYYNFARTVVLSISARDTGLLMIVQHDGRVTYSLLPYDGDTFYWPADRESELCKEAMYPIPLPGWHKISFSTGRDGVVESLTWGHDTLSKPEVFRRKCRALPKQEQSKL